LPFFGMVCLVDTDELYYCIGGLPASVSGRLAGHGGTPFDQYRAGLHLCLRTLLRGCDSVARFVAETGGALVHPPQVDAGHRYYSVLFEDPCGTRLEVNYVRAKIRRSARTPLQGGIQQRLSDA
jgi:hypothetical protein